MKKALIISNLAGFFYFLWNDIETLQNLGYEVIAAANGIQADGSYYPEVLELKEKNIIFCQIDFDSKNPFSTKNYTSYNQIKKILNNDEYSIVHCHTPIAGIVTRLAAKKNRKRGTKVIYTTHGFSFTNCSSKKSWILYYNIEKYFSKFSDAVITINTEDYLNSLKMKCKNVYQIYGVGVNTTRYFDTSISRDAYRSSIGVSSEKFEILSVGELSDRKNHRVIIEALGLLEDKENFVYVVCGKEVINGRMAEKLKYLAEEKGVNLILLGHRLDPPQMYKCADLTALPSIREGLGLVGIESLASGIPVLGANVQGIKDYVVDGETGYLCSPFSPEDFCIAIKKYMNLDKNKKEAMTKSCFNMAKKFDIQVSKEQMKEIYTDIIKGE